MVNTVEVAPFASKLRRFLETTLPKTFELYRTLRKAPVFALRYTHRRGALLASTAVTRGELADDLSLLQRLAESYLWRRGETPSDQWAVIFTERHQDIDAAIVGGDAVAFASMMRDPATCDLFYGFDSLARSLRQARRIEDRHAASLTLDALASLAEALGVRRADAPEVYGLAPQMLRADGLLRDIEKALGGALPLPNPFPGERGLETSRGVMSYRVPHAIYQAWRLVELTRGIDNPRVLEIGGGLGRTAYFARLLGIKDYTIVDIPVSALAQGYFLGRCLGDDAVALPEEDQRSAAVKLITPEQFLASTERYDVILNADSLTEIGEPVATAYWDAIKTRCGEFLSINHEANDYSVRDVMGDTPATRHPYWLRKGYVEELAKFPATNPRADDG